MATGYKIVAAFRQVVVVLKRRIVWRVVARIDRAL
jgi:hypothetical protein